MTTTPSYRARSQYVGRTARHYDADRQRTWYDRWKWHREHAAVSRALQDLAPVGALLDLPTGTGRFLLQFGDFSATVVGADISLAMLGLARHRLLEASRDAARVRLVSAEAERLPFAEGAFDLVVSIRLFQHLPPPVIVPILRELVRVTRRGVLLQAPLRQPWSRALRYYARGSAPVPRTSALPIDRSRYFPTTRKQFESLLAEHGLRLRSLRSVTWSGGQLRLTHVDR